MTILCGNCEEKEATEVCEQCEGIDAYFCKPCWGIHGLVKAFRQHSSHPIATVISSTTTPSIMHSDRNISTCEDMQRERQVNLQKLKLEKGKSEKEVSKAVAAPTAKPTIKHRPPNANMNVNKKGYFEGVKDALLNKTSDSRRNHIYEEEAKAMFSVPNMPEINSEESSIDGNLEFKRSPATTTLLEYCDNLIDAISDVTDNGEMNANTILYGFISALIIHIVTKILFGRMSIFVVVCLGVALVALVRKRQNITSMEISKLQDANCEARSDMKAVSIGDPTQVNTIGEQNEFWHASRNSQAGGPRLRPRVRPYGNNYRGRSAKKANAEQSQTLENTVSNKKIN